MTRCPLWTSLQPHAAAALAAHRVLSPMRFSRGKQPPTLPVLAGRLNPHMSHGSLGPPESTSQTASPSVQLLFCGSHGCDQHTDKQTDRHTRRPGYDCSNRPHLCGLTRYNAHCFLLSEDTTSESASVACTTYVCESWTFMTHVSF